MCNVGATAMYEKFRLFLLLGILKLQIPICVDSSYVGIND